MSQVMNDLELIDFVSNRFKDYLQNIPVKNYFSITKKYRYKGHRVFNYDLFNLAYPPENQNTTTIYFWECSLFIEELLEFFGSKFSIQVKQQKIRTYCNILNITKDRFTEGFNQCRYSDRRLLIDRFFGLIGLIIFQKFAPNRHYSDNEKLEDLGYKSFFSITDRLWEEFGQDYKLGKVEQNKKPVISNDVDLLSLQPTVHGLFAQFLNRNKPDFPTNFFISSDLDVFKLQEDLISKEECTFLWAVDELLLKFLKLINVSSPKLKLKALRIKIKYRPPHELSPDYYSEIILASKFYEMFGLLALHSTGIYLLDAREKNNLNSKQVQEIGKICFTTFLDYLRTK